ncbi:MAG: hypothetical protein QXE78_07705 [Nitrososphaeria archaeon]
MNFLFSEAEKRSWLNNHEFVSLVVYSLSGIGEFSDIIQTATAWLKKKYQEFIQKNDYEKVIDCLFGLTLKEKDLKLSSDVIDEILKSTDKISDETLAKFCILLKDVNRNFGVTIIEELERRLENEFKGVFGPSFERGLKEITSLLNSGCPSETIQLIVEAKKSEGYSWAKDICQEPQYKNAFYFVRSLILI